jgi:electron transfer flavoprotein alpha subunit
MSSPAILVVVERNGDAISTLTQEMLGLARRLADERRGRVEACVLGDDTNLVGRDAVRHGADRVHVVEDAAFEPYQADAWLPDIEAIVRGVAPLAVIAGHTALGSDLAPRLAFRLQSAAVTGCIAVEAHGETLRLTRPCYGGKANEVVSMRTSPVVFTVKAKSFAALAPRNDEAGEIRRLASTLDAASIRTRVVSVEHRGGDGAILESARTIVAGGGGMKGPHGFELAAELARLLEGAVGASRVACDLGWCPPSYQIGLSGRTVAPDLYLAIGISGTGQHMAGCSNSRNIVAINTDRDAPIFRYARYGVVGDCHAIMPALIAALAARR